MVRRIIPYRSWYIAVCNLVLLFQDASNKKAIQDVDVELCFCNFYSQNVIDNQSWKYLSIGFK